ncbi:calcium-translocating P-type ATPase, PMCA-type [Fructobacillus fructosus]|uniref:P-type Ca(2+) transporter n=1 Tax=Fructobacillus fructosus TaxID=1631 RepID=A0ABM9MT43_9LACO|nr:calcium-translocating P-type ATPase, PMCA-type [Fructobacillus fructosus]MBC9119019.1 calcium-translocating P-type ATPase, PMCA-type [Fructobacillus fructosus]MBD9365753.1 calcium-translocating P-type ATPase, PMCA-type [Leuconostoc mesenteroides]CAK1238147.1 Magnesium-transporting ATPase (P-type) (MgtA) [Fructobacillus fructosus]
MKKSFYQIDQKQLAEDLQTNLKQGLAVQEAKQRFEKNGANTLTAKKKKSLFAKFVDQFKDLMIGILLAAAFVAALTGEQTDALFILAIVIINAIFGVFQESKSENAIDALKKMATPKATVIRGGQPEQVPATDLVVGDLVSLEAGDIVPADLRLVDVANLRVEEAALTGESVPVEKTDKTLTEDKLPLGDQDNLAFMNAHVVYGRALGIVVATGMQTEVGKIAGALQGQDETKTPLQENLKSLSKVLTYLILAIAALTFVIGYFTQNMPIIDLILTAISLAVAAIPEGLPAIVTITLALGTARMAKKAALVRKLPAVETLGSTDIIGSDKTGTLTQNKMTVEKVVLNGQVVDLAEENPFDSAHLSKPAAILGDIMTLNNDSQLTAEGLVGDPTETALIDFNEKYRPDRLEALRGQERLQEIPFDSERKLMTTIYEAGDAYQVTVKGAPDSILARVDSVLENGEVRPFTKEDLAHYQTVNGQLADQALRVLAFAEKSLKTLPQEAKSDEMETGLTLVGFVAMIDPERPEVKDSVAQAKAAGIRPMMITGDHPQTAAAIADRLRILDKNDDREKTVMTGAALDELSDDVFDKRVEDVKVYARVAPAHKVRIVQAWQKKGKVVAMTGDGVNDAPALKAADIGVAMGITGTEVSKEAADMVLADDNFSTIVSAVKEGRKVFANIQKALQYLLASNLAEVIAIFMMTLLGWEVLAPVMILWINLVTDTMPAIALGLEPAQKNIMQQKPRGKTANFLSGGVGPAILWQGILQAVIVLSVYGFALAFPDHSGTALIHGDALTMAFMTLGLMQMFNAVNVKSVYQSQLNASTFKNHFFNGALLFSLIAMMAVVVIEPLNPIFHVTNLDPYQWFIVIGASIAIIVIVELVKWVQRTFFNRG